MDKGIFITFEGGEGAGKTTMLEALANLLTSKGYTVTVTREPGGISISEQIREVILNPAHTLMDARTEALLYAASRRQHLVEKVVPALENQHIVLCDRFIDSSLAYQGYARGLGIEDILMINQFAIQDLWPDLTIFMDIDPVIGLNRIEEAEQREINRLDMEAIAFHRSVHAGYMKLLELYPDRMVHVDANREQKEVYAEIVALVKDRFAGFLAQHVKPYYKKE
ncbi:dTMP kinase [Paenibacillus yanchengensis]|uniref:Thymidylate kinase n=1 Tax=Paenibacillus yanchengensis TaxID=2035833 RepID=A0ABW4YIP2_9BACL